MAEQLGLNLIDAMENLNEEVVVMVDQAYAKSYANFQVCTVFSIIYSILKVIAVPFILGFSHNLRADVIAWLSILMVLSFIQAAHYWRVIKLSQNRHVFFSVAGQLRHSAFFVAAQISPEARVTRVHERISNFLHPGLELNERDTKMLSLEIKYNVLREVTSIKIMSRLLFFLYQGIHIWGFVLFFTEPNPNNLQDYFIIIVLFLSTYQYIEFYSIVIVLILVAPFILIYYGVKHYRKKRRQDELLRRLMGERFNPMTLRGDHSCKICMDDYSEGELITVLACNQMHHFHQKCLSEWIRIAGTCPLCRVQINS